MHIIGIIAEFNPFHNGHTYMLEEARRRSGADAVIVVMSGDFVQRGTPAILNKYTRAEMALRSGADLILELPVAAAAGSAQRFAEGAAALLDGLGIVDELWFGSEEGQTSLMQKAASFFCTEASAASDARVPQIYSDFRTQLKELLSSGISYPAARMQALMACFPEDADNLRQLLSSPNNILGLEYCIALQKRNSTIIPRTLQRKGAGFHEETLEEKNFLSSASAIRKVLWSSESSRLPDSILPQVPPHAASVLSDCAENGFAFLQENDFSDMLIYQLWKETAESLSGYLDVSSDLADRILRFRPEYRDFSSFAELLKNKSMTRSQIDRALLHILLGITGADLEQALHPAYARILGFRKEKAEILSHIKKAGGLQTMSGADFLNSPAYRRDLFASTLYETVRAKKAGSPFLHECSRRLLLV
ncbi:MAG: nucleotidyltransferase family protein [Eubacteriales bacterium]|nr:nucleotidyltransferase family protein [Eubacteriales bacterium]